MKRFALIALMLFAVAVLMLPGLTAVAAPGPAPGVHAQGILAPAITLEQPAPMGQAHIPVIFVCALGVGLLMFGLADSQTSPVAQENQIALASTPVKEVKAGRKTSEFLFTLIPLLGGLATMLGFNIDTETLDQLTQALIKIAGGLVSGVAAVGYAMSRAKVKSGN